MLDVRKFILPGVVAHAFNPTAGEEQVDLWVQGLPDLQSEFQDSQSYMKKPFLEKTKWKTKKKERKKEHSTIFCMLDILHNKYLKGDVQNLKDKSK